MSLAFIQTELLKDIIGREISDIQILDKNCGIILFFKDGSKISFNGGISEYVGKVKPWGSVSVSDGELEMKNVARFDIFGENVQGESRASEGAADQDNK